jgi:hypothetical protein
MAEQSLFNNDQEESNDKKHVATKTYLDIVREAHKAKYLLLLQRPYIAYRTIICGILGKDVDRVEYSSS